MSQFGISLPPGRRQFLLTSACLAAGLVGVSPLEAAGPTEGILLTPSGGELFRVRLEMELKGNVNLPKNALASRKSALKLPIQSEATFDYEERFRRPAGVDSGEVTACERYYHEARSDSLVNGSPQAGRLRDSVRETIVRREMLPEVIYAAEDYFHRDELELLRLPISSVAADQLLPRERVQVGSEYELRREDLVSVFNLTSVEASDVKGTVVEISEQEAKIQFRGELDASVDGVPSHLRTVGKLTFDRKTGTCSWLAVAIHETREIGIAEPGFDIAATVKMVRQPLDRPIALASPPPSFDVTAPIPEDRLYVELVSDRLSFSSLMDRRWHMISDVAGASMMRMIENDRVIAQCDLRNLATLKPGAQWTLEAFQRDVRQTLGEQLRDLIEAEQFVSSAGLRVLRVAAHGAVEGVPIHWVMLHFSDDSGRRLLATFTMEGQQVDRFAGADTQLAGTLRFLGSGAEPAGASDPQAPAEPAQPEVAKANSSENDQDEVQSSGVVR